MSRLAILNYHNVAEVPAAAASSSNLYVTPDNFHRQCRVLQRLGLRGVSIGEGLRALQAGESSRCVVLSFDDGYADNLTHAAPILKKFGFGATCYVVSGYVGDHNAWDSQALGIKKPLLNEAGLQAWLAEGHEIGAHTVTHPHLDRQSREKAAAEIFDSRSQLRQMTGTSIDHFCYPYGSFNAETVALVRAAGYRSAVTTQRGLATRRDDVMLLPRIFVSGNRGLFKLALITAASYVGLKRRRAA